MKLAIFDIDGTLADSTQIDDICFFNTFSLLYDIDIAKKDWNTYKNITSGTDSALFNYIYKEYTGSAPNVAEVNRFREEFILALKLAIKSEPYFIREISGAVEFINTLSALNDYRISIATGSWLESAKIKLRGIGIDPKVFPIASSDDYENRTQIIGESIQKSFKQYNISSFEKVVYFGDGEWDYRAAKELNIDFIGIESPKKKIFASIKSIRFINNFQNCENLINYLQNLEIN
jgi:phosphoglycolate phosphatase-like HAD superfamily hydrolase